MSENTFQTFVETEDLHELDQLQKRLLDGGYRSLYLFIREFRELLKSYEDEDAQKIELLIQKARKLLPDPGAISPSWQNVWEEFSQICQIKNKLFNQIPVHTRDGEWQVIMDNPFTNQDVVCYPGLTFLEAAYLYSYFRTSLNKHEIIRLQKIETLISEHGDS